VVPELGIGPVAELELVINPVVVPELGIGPVAELELVIKPVVVPELGLGPVTELELVIGPVAAVLAVALRTKSVTTPHHRGLVPAPRVEDSAVAAAETTHEPVAAEAVRAWAVAG
jgi:hypothetical protein